jgi:DNA-binding Lrp family transcriptional regulator
MRDDLDSRDLMILGILQRDARRSLEEIATEIDLTKTPVALRIKKMERDGIIERYVAKLNDQALGLVETAFIFVMLRDHESKSVADFIRTSKRIPHILDCYQLTGEFDFLLKLKVGSIAEFERLLASKSFSRLRALGRFSTSFALRCIKEDGALPLPLPKKS